MPLNHLVIFAAKQIPLSPGEITKLGGGGGRTPGSKGIPGIHVNSSTWKWRWMIMRGDSPRKLSQFYFSVPSQLPAPPPSCPYFGESLRWDATGVEDNKFTKERILSFILGFTRIYFKWLRVSFKFERSCKTQEWHLRALKLCILGG